MVQGSKTSRYHGVSLYGRTGLYEAYVYISNSGLVAQGMEPRRKGGEQINLGSSSRSEVAAARLHDRGVLKFHSDLSKLNFPDSDYENEKHRWMHLSMNDFKQLMQYMSKQSMEWLPLEDGAAAPPETALEHGAVGSTNAPPQPVRVGTRHQEQGASPDETVRTANILMDLSAGRIFA